MVIDIHKAITSNPISKSLWGSNAIPKSFKRKTI